MIPQQGLHPSHALPHAPPRRAADGRPFVAFRVFDWDLVSADDFLGQCEVAFDSLDASLAGPSPPRWLPLYGYARAGRKVDAGEIQVAAWFEAGGGQGHQGELGVRAGRVGWLLPAAEAAACSQPASRWPPEFCRIPGRPRSNFTCVQTAAR